MKLLYIECRMGAAGDMLTAALSELHPDPESFLRQMNALGLDGVHIRREPAVRCGITGTHIAVTVHGQEEESHDVHHHDHHHDHEHEHHHHDHEHHHHHHTALADILQLLSRLNISDRVKSDALSVYTRIAEAESRVHGKPVDEIHFHEVGTMDAVADIVGVCMLMEALSPDRVIVSPIHVGSGQVHCAHGILPVPAPATAHILQGVPTYGGSIEGELCTPTGAALLRHFADEFGAMPVMNVEKIGYGMGKKEFSAANCVRVFLGETLSAPEEIVELRCNLDDMTPEQTAFATEELLGAGALDVFTTPIGMKKNRPGVLLTVLCKAEQRSDLLPVLFRHTTTLGIRETVCKRYTLDRSERTVETPHGSVRIKSASGYGVHREKPEYEDLARIARATGRSIAEVLDELP